jgi:FkbM family methyltransferase
LPFFLFFSTSVYFEPPTMGVKTQFAMIGALVIASLLLLRWSPSDGGLRAAAAAGFASASRLGADGKGRQCTHPSPKPPVSIEWTGRENMVVSYRDGVDVEVYKHEFPGSTLCTLLALPPRICCRRHAALTRYSAPFPSPHAPFRPLYPTLPAAGLDFWDRVNRGEWEPETLWVLEWYLKGKRASYVDFGSWIGPTVLFAGQFASKIYSLEPDPLSFSTLNANVNLNPHILAKTHVYHECIAPTAGLVEMAGSGESNTRMTEVLDTKFLKAGTRWKVNCRTLPQFIKEERVDLASLALIKMDTEGTELWLLPSLKPWLEGLGKGNKPAIWLSVHSPFWKDPSSAEHKAKEKLAWEVLSLFSHVYDADLAEIFPAKMEPNWCPDFCTFLLSDVAYGGMDKKKAKAALGTP